MIELAGYSTLLMNSLLVRNMLVEPPDFLAYHSYSDMLPDILTTDIQNYYNNEDYSVEISPEAYKLTILDGLLPSGKK